jgi:two-component system response regulator GlrR
MLQVLLVDDDPCQLQVRGAILRASGLVVHLATGVESALVAVRSVGEELGLVVTDHFLPGRTGADLVRELRQSSPAMPVVVLSGMPGIEDEYAGLNVSIRLKPFPPDELIGVVQQALAG